MTPVEEIEEYVDEFFYGSRTGREAQLRNVRERIKGAEYDVHALIRLFEEGH